MGRRKGLLYRKALAEAKQVYSQQGNQISYNQVCKILNCQPAREFLRLILPKEISKDLDVELADKLIIAIEKKIGIGGYLSYRQIARISIYLSLRIKGIYLSFHVMSKLFNGMSCITVAKYRRIVSKHLKLEIPKTKAFYYVNSKTQEVERHPKRIAEEVN